MVYAYNDVPCLLLLPYEDSEHTSEDASAEGAKDTSESQEDKSEVSENMSEDEDDGLAFPKDADVMSDSSYTSEESFHSSDFTSVDSEDAPEDASKPQTSSAQPLVKGYVLLPRAFISAHPQIVEDFLRYRMRVISKIQDDPFLPIIARKYSLKLFEAQLLTVEESDRLSVYSLMPSIKTSTSVHVYLHVYGHESGNDCPSWLDPYSYTGFVHCSTIDTACFCNAMEEHLEIIKDLLRLGAKIDYGHHKGGTFLHFAVKRRQKALAELLLQNGADVEAERDDLLGELYEQTESEQEYNKHRSFTRPLFIAAKKGFADICQLLLEYGAAHNSESYAPNRTPLKMAFDCNKLEAFRLLLDAEAKASTQTLLQRTISEFLRKSVSKHSSDFVGLILSYRPEVTDGYNKTTFHTAFLNCEAGPEQMQCFEQMKEYGFKVEYNNAEKSSLLLFGAIVNNWVEVVRNLIQEGADVNKVCDADDLELLPKPNASHLALAPKQNVNRDQASEILRSHHEFTPLHMAAAFAAETVIEVLLEHGAHINARVANRTPIYDACQAYNVNAVKLLISSKANVRHDPELMRFAVEGGNPEIVILLLLNRAPVSIENGELQGLLARAAGRQNLEVMDVLFRFGAQIEPGFGLECRRGSMESPGAGHFDTLQTLLVNSFTAVDFIHNAPKIIQFLNVDANDSSPPSCSFCRTYIRPCFNLLAHHVIKLESVGFSFLDQNVASLWYSLAGVNLNEFRKNCEAEVTRLQNERVGNSDATLYDILTKNMNRLASYARNKTFEETMRAGDYDSSFPIYASVLSCQFQKGLHRRKLLNVGVEVCSKLSETFKKLPELVKEEIVKYLNNYNLELLSHEFAQFTKSRRKN